MGITLNTNTVQAQPQKDPATISWALPGTIAKLEAHLAKLQAQPATPQTEKEIRDIKAALVDMVELPTPDPAAQRYEEGQRAAAQKQAAAERQAWVQKLRDERSHPVTVPHYLGVSDTRTPLKLAQYFGISAYESAELKPGRYDMWSHGLKRR